MDFLEIRNQIKEAIRKKRRTESGFAVSAAGPFQEMKNLPYDNFGFFFGPSKTVIAPRVMEETKSVSELKYVAPKAKRSAHSGVNRLVQLIERKKIVDTLRRTRDYSFLNSPDSQQPKDPAKQALQRCPKVPSQAPSSKEQIKKVPGHIQEQKMEQMKKVSEEKRPEQIKNISDSNKGRMIVDTKTVSMPDKEKKNQSQLKTSSKKQTRYPVRNIFDSDDSMDSEFDSILNILSRHNVRRPVRCENNGGDECMVSSFHDIEKEERKSLRIAKKEDEIERLRIEQEEREERRNAKSKKKC